jgi:hypothetical protein
MEQIASKLLYFIFGVAELNLACVGGVETGDHCQFGSWMMFVSLSVFLFVRLGKGCESCWRVHDILRRCAISMMRHFEELRDV